MMKVVVSIIAFFSFPVLQLNAQSGEEFFKSTCSACHTINKGRIVGPDLSGVYNRRDNNWLISFIRSSQKLIKAGDPDAVAIFNEYNKVPMPDNNLTDQQIISIIDYIREVDKGAPGTVEKAKATEGIPDSTRIAADSTVTAAADTITLNEETIGKGKTYFYGISPFANGATPCMSCHNIDDGSLLGGGKLALDLTTSYTKLGSAGITAILTNPPFPAMKAAIPGALTEEEISSLNSLLKSAAANSASRVSFPVGLAFFVLAFVIAIFIAAFTFLLYDDRNIPEGNILNSKNLPNT